LSSQSETEYLFAIRGRVFAAGHRGAAFTPLQRGISAQLEFSHRLNLSDLEAG
jgi:hypothetical protein